MFVDTFIRRPILASVCSLVIILAGAARDPDDAGRAVSRAGAAAGHRVARSTPAPTRRKSRRAVTTPLEQAINGVEGMLYMTSSSTNSGFATITVTFDITRDQDLARSTCRTASTRRSAACRPRCARPASRSQKQSTGFVAGGRRLRRARRVRLAVPQQLPRRLRQGRAQARARRRRRHDLRRAQVLDAAVARSAIGWRRGSSPPATSSTRCASRTCRSRPAASARRRRRRARCTSSACAPSGRLHRAVGVRQHHPQGGRRRRAGAAEGRRPRRARRRDLLRRSCASRGSEAVGFGVIQLPTANALDV